MRLVPKVIQQRGEGAAVDEIPRGEDAAIRTEPIVGKVPAPSRAHLARSDRAGDVGRNEEVDSMALWLGYLIRDTAHVEQLEHVLRPVARNTVVVWPMICGELARVVGEGFGLTEALPEGIRVAEEEDERRSRGAGRGGSSTTAAIVDLIRDARALRAPVASRVMGHHRRDEDVAECRMAYVERFGFPVSRRRCGRQ